MVKSWYEGVSTLKMDQRKKWRKLPKDIRKKNTKKHVQGKNCKTISKQLNIPVTTAANIKKCMVHL